MTILPKNPHGCPYLFLAPMEGVGDRAFRKAMVSIGGFDEAVTDFIRVPSNAHVKSLASVYDADEISPFPLAAQIMGGNPLLMAEMAVEIEKRGAPRIDINCGCPSNTVNGRGAGSSLLKDPKFIFDVTQAVSKVVKIPVTVKMRSGFEDTSLFKENILAAQDGGAAFIALHPRTKKDGYSSQARWDLIAEAKQTLNIPIVGNGDILTVNDAVSMFEQTNCDALMIGRGSIINPFIFHQIKAHFSGTSFEAKWEGLERYFRVYMESFPEGIRAKPRVNKLKQLFGFFFKGNEELMMHRQSILRSQFDDPNEFLQFALPLLKTLAFNSH